MKMIKLKVTQKDMINDTQTVIFEGEAHHSFNNKKHQIHYLDNEQFRTSLMLTESEALLKRVSNDMTTELDFKIGHITDGKVMTDEGSINLEIKTIDLIIDDDLIVLYYDVLSQENIVSRFMIEWEWTHEQH